jgi:Flp pilus assembly secretin CpaC
MTTTALRRRFAATFLAAALAAGISPRVQAGDAPITVTIDHAQVVKLPDKTSTLVVGNPLVADAAVQRNGIAIVTGKSYGSTNLLALDASGATLTDRAIEVRAASQGIVTVYRGMARETFTCAPLCQSTLRVGDSPEHFDAIAAEISKRNGMSSGQQAPPPP